MRLNDPSFGANLEPTFYPILLPAPSQPAKKPVFFVTSMGV